ncbi:MAG: hypothetical protein IJV05_02880 [Muribaculaceae bacterium]|nr:hypothetical protein [Muribaculaceae bacterium]
MNKDQALEELFLVQKPQFDDKDAFIASLTKRLDAVEYIKQYQESTVRRYKMAVVAAFVAGFVIGGIAIAYLLTSPSDTPLFNFDTHNIMFLEWLCANSRLVTVTGISLLMTLGIASFISNIHELKSMRQSLRHRHTALSPQHGKG